MTQASKSDKTRQTEMPSEILAWRRIRCEFARRENNSSHIDNDKINTNRSDKIEPQVECATNRQADKCNSVKRLPSLLRNRSLLRDFATNKSNSKRCLNNKTALQSESKIDCLLTICKSFAMKQNCPWLRRKQAKSFTTSSSDRSASITRRLPQRMNRGLPATRCVVGATAASAAVAAKSPMRRKEFCNIILLAILLVALTLASFTGKSLVNQNYDVEVWCFQTSRV